MDKPRLPRQGDSLTLAMRVLIAELQVAADAYLLAHNARAHVERRA